MIDKRTLKDNARRSVILVYDDDEAFENDFTSEENDMYIVSGTSAFRRYTTADGWNWLNLNEQVAQGQIGEIFFHGHDDPPNGSIRLSDGGIYNIVEYISFLEQTTIPISNQTTKNPTPNHTNNNFFLTTHGYDGTWIALDDNGNTLPTSGDIFDFNSDRNRLFFKAIRIDDNNFYLAEDDDEVQITFTDNGTGTFQIAEEFGMLDANEIFLKATNDTGIREVGSYESDAMPTHTHTISKDSGTGDDTGGGMLFVGSDTGSEVTGSTGSGSKVLPENLAAILCIWAF